MPVKHRVVDFGQEKITFLSSLYHDAKTNTFERKIEKLSVKDVRKLSEGVFFLSLLWLKQTGGRVMCSALIDLSEFISLDGTMYMETIPLEKGKNAPLLKVHSRHLHRVSW